MMYEVSLVLVTVDERLLMTGMVLLFTRFISSKVEAKQGITV
jgi:hypothetical protein